MPEKDWNLEANIETGQLKNLKEIVLVANFETTYGNEENWSQEIIDEFDGRWIEIQRKYSG
jgi:hypothetical protein